MKLLAKIFLENDDCYALGPGRVNLLRAAQTLGSLNKAARSVGMSYRWAWGRIKDSEKALGVKLLASSGTPSRGQPKILTAEGRELLEWYSRVEGEIAAFLEKTDRPAFLAGPAAGSPDSPEAEPASVRPASRHRLD
jgi:molybdate transport system regulatory protein